MHKTYWDKLSMSINEVKSIRDRFKYHYLNKSNCIIQLDDSNLKDKFNNRIYVNSIIKNNDNTYYLIIGHDLKLMIHIIFIKSEIIFLRSKFINVSSFNPDNYTYMGVLYDYLKSNYINSESLYYNINFFNNNEIEYIRDLSNKVFEKQMNDYIDELDNNKLDIQLNSDILSNNNSNFYIVHSINSNKYGVLKDTEFIIKPIYDNIIPIKILENDYWFIIIKDNKFGLYKNNEMIYDIKYNYMKINYYLNSVYNYNDYINLINE